MLFIFPEIPRLVHPWYLGRMGAPVYLGTRIADRDRSQSSYTSNTHFDPCKIGLVCPPTIEIPTYRYKLEEFFIWLVLDYESVDFS